MRLQLILAVATLAIGACGIDGIPLPGGTQSDAPAEGYDANRDDDPHAGANGDGAPAGGDSDGDAVGDREWGGDAQRTINTDLVYWSRDAMGTVVLGMAGAAPANAEVSVAASGTTWQSTAAPDGSFVVATTAAANASVDVHAAGGQAYQLVLALPTAPITLGDVTTACDGPVASFAGSANAAPPDALVLAYDLTESALASAWVGSDGSFSLTIARTANSKLHLTAVAATAATGAGSPAAAYCQ